MIRAILGLALLSSCDGDGDPTDPTDPPTDTRETGTLDTGTDPVVELAFSVAPSVAQNPNPRVPLVFILTLETTLPTTLSVEISGGTDVRTLAPASLATAHELDLLELRPDRVYTVTVTATDEAGDSLISDELTLQTPPLPSDFPSMRVLVSQPSRLEPGLFIVGEPSVGQTKRYLMALDNTGEVVWFYDAPMPQVGESLLTPEGTLRFMSGNIVDRSDSHIYEIDLRGNLLRDWVPYFRAEQGDIALQLPALHHDLVLGPNDVMFTLTGEKKEVAAYPTSEEDPLAPKLPATVAPDVIIELAEDGTILDRWPLWDLLDRSRIGRESVNGSWWDGTVLGPDVKDWAHTNALQYLPADDAFIVSMRHQDAVVKIGRTSRAVEWIVAPPENWAPEFQPLLLELQGPPRQHAYHQHTPRITPEGTLLMFDNGTWRASAYERPVVPDRFNVSRAVEFEIDEVAGTYEVVWSYGLGRSELLYSSIMGEAERLPETGNTLVVFGFIHTADGPSWRVVEVDHQQPAEVLFELAPPRERGEFGLNRVPKVRSLYP